MSIKMRQVDFDLVRWTSGILSFQSRMLVTTLVDLCLLTQESLSLDEIVSEIPFCHVMCLMVVGET